MDGLSIYQESCRRTAVSYLKAAETFVNSLMTGDPVEDEGTTENLNSVMYDIKCAIKKLES